MNISKYVFCNVTSVQNFFFYKNEFFLFPDALKIWIWISSKEVVIFIKLCNSRCWTSTYTTNIVPKTNMWQELFKFHRYSFFPKPLHFKMWNWKLFPEQKDRRLILWKLPTSPSYYIVTVGLPSKFDLFLIKIWDFFIHSTIPILFC